MQTDNTTPTYWTGTIKQFDDFGYPIIDKFIDGKTFRGPWAIMTPHAHDQWGRGLGTGKGQLYEKQEDGRWLKTQG